MSEKIVIYVYILKAHKFELSFFLLDLFTIIPYRQPVNNYKINLANVYLDHLQKFYYLEPVVSVGLSRGHQTPLSSLA